MSGTYNCKANKRSNTAYYTSFNCMITRVVVQNILKHKILQFFQSFLLVWMLSFFKRKTERLMKALPHTPRFCFYVQFASNCDLLFERRKPEVKWGEVRVSVRTQDGFPRRGLVEVYDVSCTYFGKALFCFFFFFIFTTPLLTKKRRKTRG